jgi:hypothetical protein
MTDWYAPNQQAVRADESGPAEEGSGGSAPAGAEPGGYDPGEDTVDDVKAYVEANPDQLQAVLKAEKAGKNRATLVSWLEGA